MNLHMFLFKMYQSVTGSLISFTLEDNSSIYGPISLISSCNKLKDIMKEPFENYELIEFNVPFNKHEMLAFLEFTLYPTMQSYLGSLKFDNIKETLQKLFNFCKVADFLELQQGLGNDDWEQDLYEHLLSLDKDFDSDDTCPKFFKRCANDISNSLSRK